MGTTSTRSRGDLLEMALTGVPNTFRKRIIGAYVELKRRWTRAQYDLAWDSPGVTVGKFSEAVLRFLQQLLSGKSTAFGTHIANFPDECRKLINLPTTAGVESLRIIVPRALVFLYTIRGKRGIGHVGGDIEANRIDARVVVAVCDWVLCELIRVFHHLSLEEAQALLDSVCERDIPEVWVVGSKKRVLRPDLSYCDKVMLLLYAEPLEGILTEDLCDWAEHPVLADFKRRVLGPLHKEKKIEWDRDSEIAYLSPLGVSYVQEKLLTCSA